MIPRSCYFQMLINLRRRGKRTRAWQGKRSRQDEVDGALEEPYAWLRNSFEHFPTAQTVETTKRCCRGATRRPLPLLPENKPCLGGRGLWSGYDMADQQIAATVADWREKNEAPSTRAQR